MDFKLEIAKLLAAKVDQLTVEEIYGDVEVPKDTKMGDFSYPCFKLAKVFKKSPVMIATELADGLEADFIEQVSVVNAYINFKLSKSAFIKSVFEGYIANQDDYGSSKIGSGKNVVVEFSSANIAKPFHIGHLRSTMIGNSLYRIYQTLGYNTTAVNHLGDYGTQFGKLIVAYEMWGDKTVIEENPIQELLNLYIKFHEVAKEDPSLEEKARQYFTKLENNDAQMIELWTWIKDMSLKEFMKVYDMLGVKFDSFAGESFYSDKMDEVLEILREKGIVHNEDGAEVVDLSAYNMPNSLITKSDGSTLYVTRDLAAAIYRHRQYQFDKNIYVVGSEQNLHFKQWFKIFELMGFSSYTGLEHVNFGLVALEEGKLSTRQGNVLFLEDVLNQAISRALDIIKKKSPNLANKELVAKQIGIGAVVFQDLFNQRIKDYTFSWDNALSFEGETAPYVQYAHARTCAILDKAGLDVEFNNIEYKHLTDEASMQLAKLIYNFTDVIISASEHNEPSKVTRYCVKLASAFNHFYHENHINVDDIAVKKARLALTKMTKVVLKKALWLVGVEAPEQM